MSGSLSPKDFFRRKLSKSQKENLNPFYHSDDSNFYSSDYFHCIWLHSTLLLRVPTNGAVKFVLQHHFSDDHDENPDGDDDDGNDDKIDNDDDDDDDVDNENDYDDNEGGDGNDVIQAGEFCMFASIW